MNENVSRDNYQHIIQRALSISCPSDWKWYHVRHVPYVSFLVDADIAHLSL